MTNAPPSLLPCLAAAAVSGVVSLDEATPSLLPLADAPAPMRPYWPALRRRLKRGASTSAAASSVEEPVRDDEHVFWHGRPLGTVVTLYRDALPQEQQAHIAYDTFFARFFDYLHAERYCVVLAENEAVVSLFVPLNQGNALPDLWDAFIAQAYSMPELRRTFLGVLNAVKLSNRGFSPPDVPPVTEDHAVALLGLYNATVMQRGDDMRIKKGNIDKAAATGERDRLRRELVKNEANYRGSTIRMEELVKNLEPSLRSQVKEATDAINRTGRSQIGTRSDYIAACVDRAEAVRDALYQGRFAPLRPLISMEPAIPARREAGDANGKGQLTCYICSVALGKKEGIEVSKLVVEKPSQALQSRPREQRPLACPTCIQVSMLSPIKPTDQAVIVSLRHRNDRQDERSHDLRDAHDAATLGKPHNDRQDEYLYDDHLRQIALGELNLVAGRYCQIPCTERTDKGDPLSQKLGAVQYALLKTAHLFPADALRDYMVVVSVDGGEVETPRRQTTALGGLLDILTITPSNVAKKSNMGVFSDAVRLLQADHYVEATYKLLGAFMRGPDLNPVTMTQLDTLSGVIIETWRNDPRNGKESIPMTDTTTDDSEQKSDLRTYRDVLALTGLIEPFIRQVERERPRSADLDRELKKLIEQVESEGQGFCYNLAQLLKPYDKATIPSVLMYDGRGTHTIVTEALNLLKAANVDISKQTTHGPRVEVGKPGMEPPTAAAGEASSSYRLDIDVLQGAYVYLYTKRYGSPKERRDLAYQLKLSLYARFPRLVYNGGKPNDNA